jgi:hypothetical protein
MEVPLLRILLLTGCLGFAIASAASIATIWPEDGADDALPAYGLAPAITLMFAGGFAALAILMGALAWVAP